MSIKWHPYTEPPKPFVNVQLRFGDDGERDAFGFYHDRHGCYYKSVTSMWQRASVHPTHWAEIKHDDTPAAGEHQQPLDNRE